MSIDILGGAGKRREEDRKIAIWTAVAGARRCSYPLDAARVGWEADSAPRMPTLPQARDSKGTPDRKMRLPWLRTRVRYGLGAWRIRLSKHDGAVMSMVAADFGSQREDSWAILDHERSCK